MVLASIRDQLLRHSSLGFRSKYLEEACSQNAFEPNPLSSENQRSMARIQSRFNIDGILQNYPFQITLKWLTTMYNYSIIPILW